MALNIRRELVDGDPNMTWKQGMKRSANQSQDTKLKLGDKVSNKSQIAVSRNPKKNTSRSGKHVRYAVGKTNAAEWPYLTGLNRLGSFVSSLLATTFGL